MSEAVVQTTPFPGLRPYQAGESDLFFGRDEQVDELLGRLREGRLVAVVGTSGSGKSSVVRAGLLPALERGHLAGAGSEWRVAMLTPGGDPMGELARSVGAALRISEARAGVELSRSSLGLADLARAQLSGGENLLVVVDQFEELFRYHKEAVRRDEREASAAFVKLLLTASGRAEVPMPGLEDLPVFVVLTMRSDYLGKSSRFRGLPEALNDSQYLVPRMTRAQLQEAIEGPIGMAGARIAPQLVQRLLNDIGDNADQLPVLQHALMRTWEVSEESRERGSPVDLDHYLHVAVGGVARALNLDANRAYDVLGGDKEKEKIIRRIFQRLVEPGAEDEESRRPTRTSELVKLCQAPEAAVHGAIEPFRDRRFLVLSKDDDPIVDISHESLIRLWDRLKDWVAKESDSASIYVQLADWVAEGNSLYGGQELDRAIAWRVHEEPNGVWALRYRPDEAIFQAAMRFLDDSMALREAEIRGFDPELVQHLQRLGYEIEEQVSESDFGIVYRARRLADGRLVALKTLAVNKSKEERESLVREAEVTRGLSHEGIVSILEVHREASPPFFIMEWVAGRPIHQALENAGWHVKARMVEAVCGSIEYAHRQGVVHGDLKPGNLLAGPDGTTKVLDFGLSRLWLDKTSSSRRTSRDAAGTALYMAPEQVRGEKPTFSTDVYALGVILYELLTGKPPFVADNLHDIRSAQLHQAPDLPMLRSEDVPEQLQRICLKALEKDPMDRYGSVLEMREDLNRYGRGKPVSVRPTYYNNLIQSPAKDHVEKIQEWYQKALITESEYVRLRRAYDALTPAGLKAVSESRLVHGSVLSLYLGTWLFLAGAAMWLTLHYLPLTSDLGIVEHSSLFRVVLGVVPVLLTNWLWLFFTGKGSYRFAFAAMIVGQVSLPFAVGVAVHELAAGAHAPAFLRSPVAFWDTDQQLFPLLPNVQVAFALLVALGWDVYVSIRSKTSTSATLASIHFVLLYLIVLDFWGLNYLFGDGIGYGWLWVLLAAGVLVLAGAVVARTRSTGQSRPLFAIAIVLAILASQGIAIGGPETWEWMGTNAPLGTAVCEILLGVIYLGFSTYLRRRFRVEGAVAYVLLARLAPVAFLSGIGILDEMWYENRPHFLVANLTPWAAVLVAASIVVVFLASRLQSPFYLVCGLGFLAYAVGRVAYEIQARGWLWPLMVMAAGLAVTGWLTWQDLRDRTGQDIDDVGEELIRQSRKRSAAAEEAEEGV